MFLILGCRRQWSIEKAMLEGWIRMCDACDNPLRGLGTSKHIVIFNTRNCLLIRIVHFVSTNY